MITHIVFWRLNEHANGKSKQENALLMKEKLTGIAAQIKGIISIDVGFSYNKTEEASDVALVLVCENKEILDSYDKHPEHQAFKLWLKDVRYERRVVDFES
ncbi:MAG: Dabb family protein [Bacteroidota bacterium]|nr:Dabb family protein [Bacteroidota bacterium]